MHVVGRLGEPGKNRTCDPLIKSQLLYRLSYGLSQERRNLVFDSAGVNVGKAAPWEFRCGVRKRAPNMLEKQGNQGTAAMKSAGKLGIILALAGLASCETAVNRTQAGLPDAAMSPLTDLNLRRVEVPALLEAIKSPYEPIPVVTCKAIAVSVVELTNILDWIVTPRPGRRPRSRIRPDQAPRTSRWEPSPRRCRTSFRSGPSCGRLPALPPMNGSCGPHSNAASPAGRI